ncbi:hypothetical protein HNY73_015661 [Argiope bruennichi]|uniref:Uncharacterized protein n=1 Tax=Argiope bruennichi TaxID=94029 RepID=A0A8T0EMR6_ARGBR|nr:hypothetical protein HNY73_015661 [Argiope bruennichi]
MIGRADIERIKKRPKIAMNAGRHSQLIPVVLSRLLVARRNCRSARGSRSAAQLRHFHGKSPTLSVPTEPIRPGQSPSPGAGATTPLRTPARRAQLEPSLSEVTGSNCRLPYLHVSLLSTRGGSHLGDLLADMG